MKAVIVGAGPIGCLLAIGLRERSFDVVVYDREADPRSSPRVRGHSFNLTLSQRGTQTLDPVMRAGLYERGVILRRRIFHHENASVSSQSYGIIDEHHLLSIPRRALLHAFLEEAERVGVRFVFGHKCIDADLEAARATFANGDRTVEERSDLLVGCDGANSLVRQRMALSGQVCVSQQPSTHGFVELEVPAVRTGSHPLALAAQRAGNGDESPGLHIWPRGHFMLIAQPNRDATYSATLFLPLHAVDHDGPSFHGLVSGADVSQFFRRHFPDIVDAMSNAAGDFFAAAPVPLKSSQCAPFHHGRAILFGDAAHTILPFYGQGINCSFEDVRSFLDVYDRLLAEYDPNEAVQLALPAFSAARTGPSAAIAELSQAYMRDLMRDAPDQATDARTAIERELQRRFPDRFAPLYCAVAFSRVPYDIVVVRDKQNRQRLDTLCARFDARLQADTIMEAFGAVTNDSRHNVESAASELQLSTDQRTTLLAAVTTRILQHEADIAHGRYPAAYVHDSLRVTDYEQGKQLSAVLREDQTPTRGTDVNSLLSEIFDHAIAAGTVHPHPGFMAHVPSGGLLEAAAGDFIATALNRFPGMWVAAPGLVQIESNVIRWFCNIMGYGPGSFGYLTTSGSIANMMGLMCACRRGEDAESLPTAVYTSEQSHFSVRKAARLIGIASARTRFIPTRRDYSIDVEALLRTLDDDRKMSIGARCIVATAGTTNTGAIDDLPRLAALCREQGIWLHVDACFGGFFRLTERGRAALRGLEEADSIAVDAHKSLFLPHGNSALLVKDRAQLLDTFRTPDAAYVPGSPDEDELIDFCDYGIELSRAVRGLTAWLPIKMHGITAFARALDRTLDLATYLAAELLRIPSVEVVQRHELHLPVVAFRLRSPNGADDDELNRAFCVRICANGRVYVATSELPDVGLVIRACILNHRTDRATVDVLLGEVRSALASMRA